MEVLERDVKLAERTDRRQLEIIKEIRDLKKEIKLLKTGLRRKPGR